MTIIPMAPWLPDLPDHQNPGLLVCKNAIPKTTGSYGPFSDMSVYSGAIGSLRCQGAFTGRDSAGNITIFAGDQTKLRSLSSGSVTFSDVSRTSGGAYATGTDEMWRFAQYGLMVVATNLADDPQGFLIGTSSNFSQLSTGAPKAKYAAIWRDFLVLAHLQGSPQDVRWSGIDAPTDFPALGGADAAEVQSDSQTLAGDGGHIQGIVGGLAGADGMVIQERAIWRVMYTIGSPVIFSFDIMEGARGSPAPGSIIQFGSTVAYLAEDGFCMTDGNTSRLIGHEKVNKYFFDNVDQTYLSRMSAAVDPINPIIYWAFPAGGHANGTPNRILAYNVALDRWSIIYVETEYLFRAGSFGYTADNADGLGFTVDTSPFGPDSRFWAGARPILAGFDTSHRLGFFSGSALAAEFESGDLDLGEGRRAFVSGLRPFCNGGTVTASVGYRDTLDATVSYTAATSAGADGFCPQRISTRFSRAKLSIAAGGSWSHLSGFEPRYKPEGFR